MDFLAWTATWFLWIFAAFLWVATLMVLFMIIVDVFRDHALGGVAKALWIILLVFFPLLGSIVYLIARGRGMSERWSARRAQPREDDGWVPAASTSPSDDIAKAKELLDAGTITQGEYDALKSKALGKQFFG